MTIRFATLDSPVGRLLFVGNGDGALTRLHMEDPATPPDVRDEWIHDPSAFPSAREQLSAYFAGELTQFDLELDASGTPFQRRVWQALPEIPYGKTASYIDIARKIGNPNA